jgi:hypothetical protein
MVEEREALPSNRFEAIMVMHVLLGERVNGQVRKLGNGVCSGRRGTFQTPLD